MEEWKPLIYHGEYFGDTHEVSSDGEIRNKNTGKVRKLSLNKQGYLQCVISRGRQRKIAIKIHRAVAENFVNGQRDGLVINHIDGNRLNNDCQNLEWITQRENAIHAIKSGLTPIGVKRTCTKFKRDDVINIREEYRKGNIHQKELAKKYGVSVSTICRIINMERFKNI